MRFDAGVFQEKYNRCPVCSSLVSAWRRKSVDSVEYKLDRCTTCGYTFVNPRPSHDFLMQYYAQSSHTASPESAQIALDYESVMSNEKNYPNSTIDARRIISTIESLNNSTPNGREIPKHRGLFLDVGCGFGFFSKEAQRAGYDVVALELAEEEYAIAQRMLEVEPIRSSFEEFAGTPSTFSVVLMSQILEHARDVNHWILKARDLLRKGGLLVIALPNFGSIFRLILQESDPYICPPAHLNYFNTNNLGKLLSSRGFDVVENQWISRLPPRALEKRLSGVAVPLLPVLNLAANVAMKAVDKFHLGMMITLYARKLD